MTTKTVAWSAEVVAALTAAYAENKDVKALAAQFGKTESAVRGKLVSLGVYVKKEAAAAGSASTANRKVTVVKQIAQNLGLAVEVIESLEKANKEALEAVLKATTKAAAVEAETEAE